MTISLESLKEAIAIKEQIAALEARLNKLLGGGGGGEVPSSFSAPVKKGRGKMSVAGRAKIAAAQRARWAKQKGTSAPGAKPAKKKRKLSPEGRARIVAALKKRWAEN